MRCSLNVRSSGGKDSNWMGESDVVILINDPSSQSSLRDRVASNLVFQPRF